MKAVKQCCHLSKRDGPYISHLESKQSCDTLYIINVFLEELKGDNKLSRQLETC
jgi:hypothetical protein